MLTYEISLMRRPIQTEEETAACGDKGVICENNDEIVIGVFDGAGHGIKAAEAANKAISFIEKNENMPLEDIFDALHKTLRGTRGGALSLARIKKETGEMVFSGIGNVGARLFDPINKKLVTRDGVLGSQMPKAKVINKALKEGDVLILYSDGIRDRISEDDYPHFFHISAQEITRITIDYLSKPLDDASCLTLKVLHD